LPKGSEAGREQAAVPAVVQVAGGSTVLAAVNQERQPAKEQKAEAKPSPDEPQEPKHEAKPDKPEPKPLPGGFKLPKEITLTPEQEAKRDALVRKFAPQQEALAEAEKAVYTREQQEQLKAAREAGKKGKEANDFIAAAVKLSSEQQAKLDDIQKKRKALDEHIKAAVLELLTPEQRELAAKKGPGGPGKPKGAPKKPVQP
jgi:hypothetical protein